MRNLDALPADLQIPLTPAAVLTGTVEDQDGLPVVHAMVETLSYTSDNGGRKLSKSQWAYTDEKGEYRIPGLPAAHIYLRVTPDELAQWNSRYGARLYPSTTDFSRAEAIEIKAGEKYTLPAIRLTRMEGVSISGVAEFPSQDLGSVYLHSTGPLAFQTSGQIQPDGSFTIAHVPPGSFILDNLAPLHVPHIGQPIARTAIEVAAADLSGVVLIAKALPSIDVPGKLTFRDGSRPESMRVMLRGENLGDGSADANADGAFVVKGLTPGHYRISVLTQSAPKSPFWNGAAVSALLDDREALFEGFDVGLTSPGSLNITMGTRSVLIAGKLSDGSGQPVMNAEVVLMPVQPGNGGSAVTDSVGQFKLNLVTAGDYHVYLRTNLDPDSPFTSTDYLAAHAGDIPWSMSARTRIRP